MDGQIGVVFWIGMEVSPVAKASLYGNLQFMGVRIGKWICDFSGSRQRDAFE